MGSDGEQKTAAPAAATALSFAKFDLLRKTLIITEKLLVLAASYTAAPRMRYRIFCVQLMPIKRRHSPQHRTRFLLTRAAANQQLKHFYAFVCKWRVFLSERISPLVSPYLDGSVT